MGHRVPFIYRRFIPRQIEDFARGLLDGLANNRIKLYSVFEGTLL